MDKSKFGNKKEWRKFGIGLAVMLCSIGTLQFIFDKDLYPYFYFAAAMIFSASLIFPALLYPVFVVFCRVGVGLGLFTTKLVLILLFYFLFAPLGFLLKMTGKDFLDLKLNKAADTYWKKRKTAEFDKKSYENQF
ncbi:MAG: hypothetical protein A2896_01560 [Candidatus Nealsonbacteria bacterium RIFCSPLOWO2_01_FULL_43_32]|uniref:SxtJ n=1 Tax=Candidatus Nealsonbacteria bacterium RIFCSPLOWO2_01_FULL_43_32 TaxID=1801672 RepID=A0A1G2EFM6_9BACT|nr:MAG: hypothetical protein A2896_01560 [Candidatus Nealsonbacteria bacterium RIFCSPLOWO2_01_FULL_43_32]